MKRLTLLLALLPSLAWATDVTIKGNVYTLPDHPRVWLDGPAGTVTTRLKDPDGAGALVAPQASDLNPAYVALKAYVRDCRAAPTYCSASNERAITALALALDWYMDNTQADSLTAAKARLNTIELWMVHNLYQFGCDVNDSYCGTSSWSDWPSVDLAIVGQAYSLVRSEMSAGERTAFAQKMFNDDVAGYEDTCTNQLQQEVGATATYTSGSTAVTGTNLDGLTAGRVVYIKPGTSAGAWATISTVNSPTSITLTGPPQGALGGNFASQTASAIHEIKPWTSTTCGAAWTLAHHAYMPIQLMGGVAFNYVNSFTVDQTTINVSSVAGLPAPPFYIRITGTLEIMKVTEINGTTLTVGRGQLGSVAKVSQFPPRPVQYNRYIPNPGTGQVAQNLYLQKIYGHLIAALAVADDSATAVSMVQQAADAWIDYTYSANRDMWTGVQQAGSTNYGPGRQQSFNTLITAALKAIGGSPSLDKTGDWLENIASFWLYSTLPTNAAQFVPWGQADIAITHDYHSDQWGPALTYLLGESSDSAKYWNYWQRTEAAKYTSENLTSGSNERLIPFALMWQQETDTSADYKAALPTQKAFNVVEGDATRSLNAWISRTGWSSTSDTLIFQQAYNLDVTSDHIGTGAPGGYRIYKNGWALTENTIKDTGEGTNTNMPLFGGAANLKSVAQNQRVDMDKTDSGTGWAFSRTNMVNAYTATAGATRALRYLVHFKKAASPDYLVAYDDMATSSAKTLSQNLIYDKAFASTTACTGTATGTMNDSTVPDLQWTGTGRRLNTAIVLPAGTGVAGPYTSISCSHWVNLCASTDGSTCAAVTSAEFLVVHRPSTDTADTMPTVAALGTIDADYVGVQIEGTAPSVAVFPKVGAYQTSTSFTTDHASTAQYVVTGLEAGIYDVVRGVTTIVDDETIAADGTIAFESVAGAFTIARSGEVPAITITTATPLPNCVQHESCSWHIDYTGGTPPVTYSQTLGSLCTGQSFSAAGDGSGVPTVGQTCTFTVHVEDALSATDDKEFSLTIVTPSPTLSVVATPGSTSVAVQFGSTALDEGQSCEITVSTSGISGDGYAEFTATEANKYRVFGLSNGNTGNNYDDIDYGIDARGDGGLWVFEGGVQKHSTSTYEAGDTLRVDVTGGVVRYSKNGTVFYTSAQAPTYPLLVDTSLYNIGATITDAIISTGGVAADVVWTSDVGVTVTGNTLTKTAATSWVNAGAVSTTQIDAGSPIGPVASTTSANGPSTRTVSLSGLLPETPHTASVVCGTVASGQDSFTTTAAATGPTVSWTYKVRPNSRLVARGVTSARVSFNVVGEAADTLSSGCGTGCGFTLPLLSQRDYELQHEWRANGEFDDAVAYWDLDEESGTRADTLGTYDLTDNATVLFGAGINSNAAAFVSADSEYLSNAAMDWNGKSKLSISAWVRPAATTALFYPVISAAGSGGATQDAGLGWRETDKRVYFYFAGATHAATGVPTIAADQWYHVVSVFDGTLNGNANRFKMWVDGVAQTLSFFGGDVPSTITATAGVWLNRVNNLADGNVYGSQRLDELTVWYSAKTADEVAALFAAGAGKFYTVGSTIATSRKGLVAVP